MRYTAHQHRTGVIKVETKDRVICDCIGDMETAEKIARALNAAEPDNSRSPHPEATYTVPIDRFPPQRLSR